MQVTGLCNWPATGGGDGRWVQDHPNLGRMSRRRRRLAAVATGSGQVATWTVLFTDMVGSTEMRVRVGEEAFDRVRADLDRRIALAVAAHAGAAVKSTGDGVMAAFAATASALRCATAIQGAVADHNRQTGDGVALRVGMSVGDAVVDGGDLQGTAVVEAARLCAVAEPGTVLCSEAVRSVSANRSGCVFGEPRSVELKGLPVPVVVHEVVAEPSADRSDGRGLSFRVLGPLEIERDGRAVAVGGPKERLVLAVLLAGAGTVVSVDALVDAVWGERPPRTAERTIHAYIARLRRALEPRHQPGGTQTVIETVGRGYRLAIDPDQLDAGRFEQVARSGADQLGAGDAAAAATALPRRPGGVAGRRLRGAGRRRALRRGGDPAGVPTAHRGRGQGRRRPGRGTDRGSRGGGRGRGGGATVPRTPLGPAHGRPVPIGAPGRRPGRLPACPARAGRRVGGRAGPRAAPVGGGDPRPGPGPRLDAGQRTADGTRGATGGSGRCRLGVRGTRTRDRVAAVGVGGCRGRRRRVRLDPRPRGRRQDAPGRRARPGGARRWRGGAVRAVRPRTPGCPGAGRPGTRQRRRFDRTGRPRRRGRRSRDGASPAISRPGPAAAR